MALYFFDSSALVKRYVHEQGVGGFARQQPALVAI